MKVALDIVNKLIVDELPTTATEDNKFLLANGYKLLEVGNPYNEDGSFIEVTDEHLRPYLMTNTNDEFTESVSKLTQGIPSDEVMTWTKQETEARAWVKDNSAYTPFIDALLVERTKYDKAGLVAKIIEKADAYAAEIGRLTGMRQHEEDKLKGE